MYKCNAWRRRCMQHFRDNCSGELSGCWKWRLNVVEGHWKWYDIRKRTYDFLLRPYRTPFSRCRETLAENANFSQPTSISGLRSGEVSPCEFSNSVWTQKSRLMGSSRHAEKIVWRYLQPFWCNMRVCRADRHRRRLTSTGNKNLSCRWQTARRILCNMQRYGWPRALPHLYVTTPNLVVLRRMVWYKYRKKTNWGALGLRTVSEINDDFSRKSLKKIPTPWI